MEKEEFDRIASKIIAASMSKMLKKINESKNELSDRDLIIHAYSNALTTARDLLFEYHRHLELYLNSQLPTQDHE